MLFLIVIIKDRTVMLDIYVNLDDIKTSILIMTKKENLSPSSLSSF